MGLQFVDLATYAKMKGVSEPIVKGMVKSGVLDCYVYLQDNVSGTQDSFLPAWSFEIFPDVRWRDRGSAVDPSGVYEHGTMEIRTTGSKRRVIPRPRYSVIGWVRVAQEFATKVLIADKRVSLEGWSVAVDGTDGTFVVLNVVGDSEFVDGAGFENRAQLVAPDELMIKFEPEERSPASQDAQEIDPRREKSLLRVIRALDVMCHLPERGAASAVVLQLQQLGFPGPDDETVRRILKEARGQKP